MDAQEAVRYLTNVSWRGSRLGLERVEELLALLGNPHEKLKYVHVAGTNGKGSVSAMLANSLTQAGFTTGLYTSPYINVFNERIQVNGFPISDAALVHTTEQVRALADTMPDHPTEFELITVLALLYFYAVGCDIVVLEVGLGGRLDATNVISAPEVAVITPISYDHVAELGDTLAKIAREKAGIIKPGCAVAMSHQEREAETIIQEVCKEQAADLTVVDTKKLTIRQNNLSGIRFTYTDHKNMEIHLLGAYQAENAALVLEAIDSLRRKGWEIPGEAIREGLKIARWPARFEIVHEKPYVVVDGGHNVQCVSSIVENLKTYFPNRKITFLAGVMADKEFDAMFGQIVPLAAKVFTVTPNHPRALPAEDLAGWFSRKGVRSITSCSSVEDGVGKAMQAVSDPEKEVICAFGSFYMAGAIRRFFGVNQETPHRELKM